MSPEQRLTVREAVEMIARYGAAPISESALRARIRNRKIGAVRVGGRVYTNPLNLVTAGLLPVEVLSGTVGEIDDAELHAWLNPDEPVSPENAGRAAEPANDPDTIDDLAAAPSNAEPDAGPLERALSESEHAEDHVVVPSPGPARVGRSVQGGARRRSNRSGVRRARLRSLALVGISVAVAGVAAIAIGSLTADQSAAPQVAQMPPMTLVSAVEGEPPVKQIDRAVKRRDYDRALDLAALSGDHRLLARTQRTAADAVLARAERARKGGHLDRARRHVRTVTASFGDPRPAASTTISARIGRDLRSARHAKARRARATSSAPVVAGGVPVAASPPAASTASPSAVSSSPPPATASPPARSSASGGSTKRKRDPDKPVDPGLF